MFGSGQMVDKVTWVFFCVNILSICELRQQYTEFRDRVAAG